VNCVNSGLTRGVSSIAVTAALSVAILISAAGMQLGKAFAKPMPVDPASLEPVVRPSYLAVDDEDGNGTPDWQDELIRAGVISAPATSTTAATGTPSTDPLSNIGQAVAQTLVNGYMSLAQYNAYTPERGETLASTIADNLRAPAIFVPHTVEELSFDSDTSSKRVLQYRSDMRVAFEPMINAEEHELTLFAGYVDSHDQLWLERLAKAAANYRAVEKNLLSVSVPQDAAPEHLRAVNAIGSFAENLERMVRFANDPLASMALLRTYNDKEREFDLAFDALIKYYARKVGNN
jgi:hypothetical protein